MKKYHYFINSKFEAKIILTPDNFYSSKSLRVIPRVYEYRIKDRHKRILRAKRISSLLKKSYTTIIKELKRDKQNNRILIIKAFN